MTGLVLIRGGLGESGPGRGVSCRTSPPTRAWCEPGGRAKEVTAHGDRKERLHLTRRGRVVVVTLAAAAGLVAGLVGGRADAAAVGESRPPAEVVVEEGDTLWSVAKRVAGPGEDLRDVVLEIQSLNGRSTAALLPGDVLVLPDR